MTQSTLSFGSNDKSHRAAVLELLRDGAWHSGSELRRVDTGGRVAVPGGALFTNGDRAWRCEAVGL